MPIRKNQTPATKTPIPEGRAVERLPLKNLHFDVHNPRFGPGDAGVKDETRILDRIVEQHGVGDVISSLSVNGYSDAEPLIGLRQKNGSVIIKEGNRRLAACLIIARDSRAKNQAKRMERYASMHAENGSKLIDPVPVTVFEEDEYHLVLPYLGVKHIVGAAEWSSWAKAAWADELINRHEIPMGTAMAMLGDEQKQIPRILASYYFVQQLIKKKKFDPNDSVKKGKGGALFPFSLIYNGLGYSKIKEWVGFESELEPRVDPVPAEKLDAAADFMDFVCGNSSKGIEPVITDNRQFTLLNKVAGDAGSTAALKRGETIEEVAKRMDPAPQQLMDGLIETRQILEDLLSVASQKKLTSTEARDLAPPAEAVARLAHALYQRIQSPLLDLFGDEKLPAIKKATPSKRSDQ
ncbi:MAG: hypothetical protein K9N47_24985 [Prosthecobacter sp.]|uniref:hypothetical protein n=1 Tax=Prosthecobacter sp. TaxID=1965333 RepID=UPI00261E5435|nr:hypothetical protein [Prosthecobacter sp.]MCF7789401.1 hypothetical protein [Prosthecobacter sp.]